MTTLTMGREARISVLLKVVHPREYVIRVFPQHPPEQRLENAVVLRLEMKNINRRMQLAVVFTQESFLDRDDSSPIEMHAVTRYCKVTREGPSEHFFDGASNREGEREGDDDDNEQEETHPVIQDLQQRRGTFSREDITLARGIVDIDDDNVPAPENIPPPPAAQDADNDVFGNVWGHNGICYRRVLNVQNTNASIRFQSDIQPTRLQLFELFFPKSFVLGVIIPQINANIQGERVLYGEYLRWLGMWFLMATIQGPQRHDFWSDTEVTRFEGAPFRLGDLMSRSRFEEILRCIRYTDRPAPNYNDPFHEVRQMIEAWNNNMSENFTPSWVSCIDQSMSTWINQYTCPGFVFCPRKPWPFGNEYHTECCGLSRILYTIELVEGKDEPRERPRPEHDDKGKTVGLLLRLTKSIWNQAKVVVLGSGFCVLEGIAELRLKGVFAAALIKKRQCWPRHVEADTIIAHFDNKQVGDVDSISGSLNTVPLNIFAMKEPDYVMMLMSSYGTNERMGGLKTRQYVINGENRQDTFQYPEVVHNHFKFRHAVNDHNDRRQSPISLEETWGTEWWPNRVHAFLLAVTEVNCCLGNWYFYNQRLEEQLEYRKRFAHDLIFNDYLAREEAERPRRRPRSSSHRLTTLPRGKKFRGAEIVNAQSPYAQRKCITCNRKVRTYCLCSPGVIRCGQCFADHFSEVES